MTDSATILAEIRALRGDVARVAVQLDAALDHPASPDIDSLES